MKNKLWFAILAVFLVLVTVFAASAQTALFTISSTPSTTASLGEQYTYQMTSNVLVSGTSVNYGKIIAPTGMNVNPTTGLVTWTPTSTGTFSVNLSAYNVPNQTYYQYQSFNIVVGQSSSNMLEIDEVEVKVNGKKDTLSGPGTIDDEAELEDEIEITVTIKNNFNVDNDDTVIRSINVEISSDLDSADGLDDSMSRLEAGDDDESTFSFTIDPEEVIPSDAPFDITIEVEGETDDGTIYRDEWTLRLDMETRSRDLYIISAEATPLSFTSCADNKMRITTEFRNIGTRDLDDAAVRYKVSAMGINKIFSDIELDSGDDDDFSEYITIPKGMTPGTYTLEIDALPQRTSNTVTSMSAIEFTVLKCTTDAADDEEDNGSEDNTNTNNNGNSNGGTVIIPDITVTGTPVATATGKGNFFDFQSPLYLVLLGAVIVLLILVIVLLLVRLTRA